MNTKNIFYSSSANANFFPDNTRSDFQCLIDEQRFNYLGSDHIKAAVKNVVFQNKFSTFHTTNFQPDIVIIQDYGKNFRFGRPSYKYEGIYTRGEVDIGSGLDYYLFEIGSFGEGKNFSRRNFTDVKLVCRTVNSPFKEDLTSITIHNIYLHDESIESVKELIAYLNRVYSSIEFDLEQENSETQEYKQRDTSKLFRSYNNGHSLFYDKRSHGLDVLLSYDLCKILGYDEHDLKCYDSPNLRTLVHTVLLEQKIDNSKTYKLEDLKHFTSNSYSNTTLDSPFPTNPRFMKIFDDNLLRLTNSVKSGRKINLTINKPNIIGLRTSLNMPDIFKSGYDTQIEFFNVRDHPEGIQIHEVKNPIFFDTTLEKLANPEFKFIDVETGKTPNFTLGVPTYIQVLTKTSPMSKRFNLFLDSSDKISKALFPSNTPYDFTIRLPERVEFGKHWEVTLKNLFTGNDFFNLFEDTCTFKAEKWRTNGPLDLSGLTPIDNDDLLMKNKKFEVKNGRYKNIEQLCNYIETMLKKEGFSVRMSIKNGKLHIKSTEEVSIQEHSKRFTIRRFQLKFSPHLAIILGMQKTLDREYKVLLDRDFVGDYKPQISLLAPVTFLVHCDVVQNCIFGTENVQILRVISSNFNSQEKIKSFSFYQDEFVDLAVKEFSTIRLRISDNTGNLIKSTQSHPTRCQIQFLKKDI